MIDEGPPLAALTHRLAECPADFLAEPRLGEAGVVRVAAVVADLLRALGAEPPPTLGEFEPAANTEPHRRRLRAALIACWLLYDPWFREEGRFGPPAYAFLTSDLPELAALVNPSRLVSDPDRREELSRLCLKALGLRPAGETAVQAQDRLTTISSLERARVVRAARAAEARMRQIREAMKRKAAEEAAAKYRRE